MKTRREMGRMVVATLVACQVRKPEARAFAPPRPTPPAPRKAPPPPGRTGRTFPAGGIKKVVVRANQAEGVEVVRVPGARVVTISGIPEGGAPGYHPADPNWRETPPAAYGLDFAAKAHGTALVISAVKEMSFIHHQYNWTGLRMEVPEGVEVVKEPRTLSGKEGLLPTDLGPPQG